MNISEAGAGIALILGRETRLAWCEDVGGRSDRQ
jgi:hypothetical protein